MSDKKTAKVYLLVECEVEEINWAGSTEERVIDTLDHILFNGCAGMKNKGYRTEWLGPMVFHKPTTLPGDIKDILWRDSVRHLPLHKQLEAAIIENSKGPAKERLQEMIDRGAINEKGEVLLRGPGDHEDTGP
ncbi:MAG: hypothetical protein P4L67_04400 [Candidatus Pacebacteria bacterium]|nr:hypothetical protein [Candidatus Paceibacterota bacterium]